MAPFETLPAEIYLKILRLLKFEDVVNMSQTNGTLYSLICSSKDAIAGSLNSFEIAIPMGHTLESISPDLLYRQALWSSALRRRLGQKSPLAPRKSIKIDLALDVDFFDRPSPLAFSFREVVILQNSPNSFIFRDLRYPEKQFQFKAGDTIMSACCDFSEDGTTLILATIVWTNCQRLNIDEFRLTAGSFAHVSEHVGLDLDHHYTLGDEMSMIEMAVSKTFFVMQTPKELLVCNWREVTGIVVPNRTFANPFIKLHIDTDGSKVYFVRMEQDDEDRLSAAIYSMEIPSSMPSIASKKLILKSRQAASDQQPWPREPCPFVPIHLFGSNPKWRLFRAITPSRNPGSPPTQDQCLVLPPPPSFDWFTTPIVFSNIRGDYYIIRLKPPNDKSLKFVNRNKLHHKAGKYTSKMAVVRSPGRHPFNFVREEYPRKDVEVMMFCEGAGSDVERSWVHLGLPPELVGEKGDFDVLLFDASRGRLILNGGFDLRILEY
ncbi:hypothetical protein SISNIDRAFT_453776 [Sistotremastrum niveocremeum HHB9708]|uniref:F-box domain-containing protein n=2 Tax=Sistotremastraceae TaxID=3402574 RepID=A0A164VDK9_9AGAM|nr:hypothetical protein SISNIDRAFT_453776 [Sistotremastrum niveocremeum HHB9708]KZT33864.1 hypothetical protein SISSUDRAFT_1053728 [Sistotremastrum suecicum HHB10207 ss-3]